MKEQSHKAEMATALRGDFARLRARGVATTLPTPPVELVGEAPPRPAPTPAAPTPEAIAPRAVAVVWGRDSPTTDEAAGEDAAPTSPAESSAGGSWLERLRRR